MATLFPSTLPACSSMKSPGEGEGIIHSIVADVEI